VERMGRGEVFTGFWLGGPKRPRERPRRRWEDNIKTDLREIGIDGANWIRLAQDRVQWRAFVDTVMNLRFPYRKYIVWQAELLSAFQRIFCTME
jgi:hypothetical protein